MMVVTDKDCLDFACECVRLAGLTADPKVQAQLLALAKTWMEEAQQVRSEQCASFSGAISHLH
jgi:hypothetical protein